jgi:hypothetical protein
MSNPRFAPELKDKAVRQVTQQGYSAAAPQLSGASVRDKIEAETK